MNKLAGRTLLLIVLGGGSVLTVAWAQAPEAKKESSSTVWVAPQVPPDDDLPPDAFRARFGEVVPPRHGPGQIGVGGIGSGRGFGMGRRFPHPMSHEEMQEFEAFHQAIEKLKTSKNDADKTSATNELSKMLEKSFQRDLERREHDVAQVEARVQKLRDQIEKRKKAKADILNLRLKTIVNEAEGLGFPGSFEPESSWGRPSLKHTGPSIGFGEWSETPPAIPRSAPPAGPDTEAP